MILLILQQQTMKTGRNVSKALSILKPGPR